MALTDEELYELAAQYDCHYIDISVPDRSEGYLLEEWRQTIERIVGGLEAIGYRITRSDAR